MNRTHIALFVLIAGLTLSACSQKGSPMDSTIPTQATLDLEQVQVVPHETFKVPEQNSEDDVVHYGVNRFNVEDMVSISSDILDIEGAEDNGYIVLDFSGSEKNHIYTDSLAYSISAGESAVLSISVAAWKPELKKVEIGIVNRTTGESWYLERSFGNILDYTCTFPDLTAGTYNLYLRSLEASQLEYGYMRYSLT